MVWLALGGSGSGSGRGPVEFEQRGINLQRAGQARQTIFDRNKFPELVLPPFGFRFGAADHGGEPGQDHDRIGRTAICDDAGAQISRIGDAFFDCLRQCEHGFGLRRGEIAAVAGSAGLHSNRAPLWRARYVERARHGIMCAAMRDKMHL
jgi:hypothetical protein